MNWRIFLTIGALTFAACSGGGSSSGDDDDDVAGDDDDDVTGDDDDDSSAVDSDGDGLSDDEEVDLGLDPNVADSDLDGLDDGAEIDLGTDPLSTDSDGDGYLDGDEVREDSDPTDANDKIYEGGWPYSSAKFDLDENDVPSTIQNGELFIHFTAKDQFTDTVDVWDFKNDEGKLIIVDISAQWCGPCNALSAWLDGDYAGFDAYWLDVREAVDSGDVYWITILGESNFGVARQKHTEQWYEDYPHPNIAILADIDYTTANFAELGYWPTVIVLNPDLTVAWRDETGTGWTGALDYVNNQL